ncbi:MAG: zinc-binding dehydrogenase [Candidatus Marinimicrobia bacterium]|nr:zinc-binding dehydrogenase [Candidatus Neomarinimicrobiota bacterium]
MKAVRIHEFGDYNVLKVDQIDEPVCMANQVKIQMKACGINHLDIWVRQGLPWIKFPWVLGSDGSGIIVEIGNEVKNWNIGDEIVIHPGYSCGKCTKCQNQQENFCYKYGILGESINGVQQEFICLNPSQIVEKPTHLNFSESASMPLVFMTSWQMLVERANLKKNEWVLIYGGTSGVGASAIQIAKYLGANIISTVGNDNKIDKVISYGADFVINHSNDYWQDEIKLIQNKFDVIFEHIGSATWKNSMNLLNKGGRVVTCGATTGYKVEIDLRHLFFKQQSILGSTMSNFNNFYTVMEKISSGVFKPCIDSIYSIEDVWIAHKKIEERLHIGKVVLEFN